MSTELDHEQKKIKEAAIVVVKALRENHETFNASQLVSISGSFFIWLENPSPDNLHDAIESKGEAWRIYHQAGNLKSLDTISGTLARATWLVGEAIWYYSQKDRACAEYLADLTIKGAASAKNLLVEA
ncbi:MAG: hypothetical protein WCI63_00235 [bacterium]